MIQTIAALTAFGAVAALGLWWGVRRDDGLRGSPRGSGDEGAGFPLDHGNAWTAGTASWGDPGCGPGDSGGGDCGGGGD